MITHLCEKESADIYSGGTKLLAKHYYESLSTKSNLKLK